jgi:hypothetical protein
MLRNGPDDRVQQQKEQADSDNECDAQADEERTFSVERQFFGHAASLLRKRRPFCMFQYIL